MQKLWTMDKRMFVSAVLFLVSLIAVGHAQTAVDGAIGGTVLDNSGAVVAGAQILVQNIGTNAQQSVVTDSSGYFRVLHLQPGSYNVTISGCRVCNTTARRSSRCRWAC